MRAPAAEEALGPFRRAVGRVPRWGRRVLDETLVPVAGILAMLVVWQFIVMAFHIPRYLLVGPWEVLKEVAGNPAYYGINSETTFVESILGFTGGVAFGVASGLLIYYVPLLRSALYPSLIGLNTIPKVALAPLFIVWFGAGETAKVVVALLIAFFPVLVNTIDGLNGIPVELQELAAICDATPIQRFRCVDFMYSLPSIFTGMKVSIAMAVGGAVVGEFIAGSTGLGYVVIEGIALVNLPSMFGGFVILTLMALLLFSVLDVIERIVLPWARHREMP